MCSSLVKSTTGWQCKSASGPSSQHPFSKWSGTSVFMQGNRKQHKFMACSHSCHDRLDACLHASQLCAHNAAQRPFIAACMCEERISQLFMCARGLSCTDQFVVLQNWNHQEVVEFTDCLPLSDVYAVVVPAALQHQAAA